MDACAVAAVEQVAGKPAGLHAVSLIMHRAVRRHQHSRACAAQQMRIHRTLFRSGNAAAMAAALNRVQIPLLPFPTVQPHRGRFPLLQQQFQRARFRDPHKGAAQRMVRQHIAQRAQRHALMVRHVALHQPGLIILRVEVIRRFIEPEFSAPARRLHGAHVFRSRVRRGKQRQQRRIRRNHALRRSAAQRKPAQTKRPVLIIQMHIKGIVARFGHAPRALALTAQRALRLYGRALRSTQQRILRRIHEQLRHQIFKHRSTP